MNANLDYPDKFETLLIEDMGVRAGVQGPQKLKKIDPLDSSKRIITKLVG